MRAAAPEKKIDTENSIYGLSKVDFVMNHLPPHKAFILGTFSFLLGVPIKIILSVRLC
jgi:hypothetical protein